MPGFTDHDIAVLELCLARDMTAQEIATVLNMAEAAVEAELSRRRAAENTADGWPQYAPPAQMPSYENVTAADARQARAALPPAMPTSVRAPAPATVFSGAGSAAAACADRAGGMNTLLGAFVRSS